MASEPMRWWRWIGPWPLRPLTLGILSSAISLATNSYALTIATAPRLVFAAIAVGSVSGATLWLTGRFAPVATTHFGGYLVAVALTAFVGNAARFITGTNLAFPNFGPITDFSFTWLRSIALALLILALLGASQRRLQIEVNRADTAVIELRSQAETLLTADEEIRRQVAMLLHDRVQAGLIAASLRLRRALRDNPPDAEEIAGVLAQLEELRGLDVRHAVRVLSPNLREVDLLTALETLGSTYGPAMAVTCEVTGDVPVPLRLGIYRIVEQGLLNAAMHGGATRCEVRIEGGHDEVRVMVSDDGSGLPAVISPGLGTTLIDTWCRILGAGWSRSALQSGTLVEVWIPLPSQM